MTDVHDPSSEGDASLREELRALRVDPPDTEFRRALRLRLAAEPAPAKQGWLPRWLARWPHVVWPGVGVLAGAATFAVLMAVGRGQPADVDADHVAFTVPAAKVAVIRLSFAADVAVEDVTFEVALPEGLAFWSGGERLTERRFRWPGRLAAGDNVVPVAVRGERAGRYRVKARVEAAGEVLEQEVVLDVLGGPV